MENTTKYNLWFYIWWLIGLFFIGGFVSQIIASAIIELKFSGYEAKDLLELTTEQPQAWHYVRVVQIIHAIFSFLIPSLIIWKMYSGNLNFSYPKNKRSSILAFTVIPVLLFTFHPLAQSFYIFNKNIQFFEPLHSTLLEMEVQMEMLITGMLADQTLTVIMVNFFIIAIVASILEELFFRGVLQRILSDHIDHHLAIFIAAFAFSFIHFQFFGFIPRLAIGIFFGYLYWHTKRLSIPIFAHFLFNSMQLIAHYYISPIGNETTKEGIVMLPISITITSTILFFSLYFVFYNSLIKKRASS